MQLVDYFEDVVVLDAAATSGAGLQQHLRQRGLDPWSVRLDTASNWRDTLIHALGRARGHRAPGVLVLLSQQDDDQAFWRSQDLMLEQLDARRWDIVYLGHAGHTGSAEPDGRPALVHCDMPPSGVSAIAVRCEVLEMLVQTMPDQGIDGPLSPDDWLAIACWLVMDRVRPGSSWAAWPPLMH